MRNTPTILALSVGLLFALACGGVPTSPEDAHAKCAADEIEGCHYLAKLFPTDDVVAREEHPAAFEFHANRMCQDGDPYWCTSIGYIRMTGEGGTKDWGAAKKLFKSGCDVDGVACYQLAVMLIRGESDDGSSGDASASARAFEKGCDLGNVECCIEGWKIYDHEDSGAQDLEKAKALMEKGCKLDPELEGCE